VFSYVAMKRCCRGRIRSAMAIKTIDITCERSPADWILYLPVFDDPIFALTPPPPPESCRQMTQIFVRYIGFCQPISLYRSVFYTPPQRKCSYSCLAGDRSRLNSSRKLRGVLSGSCATDRTSHTSSVSCYQIINFYLE
jgi:hypothetical protein